MKNIPQKIYLQTGEDADAIDFNNLPSGSVTWCADKINSNDIEYARLKPIIKVSDFNTKRFKEDLDMHFKIFEYGKMQGLADKFNVDRVTLWRCINGKLANTTELHYQLCEEMGMSVNNYLK